METFIRKELKYLIDHSTKQKFLQLLQDDLIDDLYPESHIYTIYLDTPDLDLMRICENKPDYRFKARLRAYRPAIEGDDEVFFELKKKICGTSFKRRRCFTLDTLASFYQQAKESEATDKIKGYEDMAAMELADVIRRHDLQPAFSLYAHRLCRVWKEDPSLRITIDDVLTGRLESHGLCASKTDRPLLEEGMNILEIKCAGALPLRLARILDALSIQPASFSKAGVLYAARFENAHIERNSLPCPN